MRALSTICILSCLAFSQQSPEIMMKLAVRLESPEIAKESFAAQPKLMYRAGNGYCRTEELPDIERGIHGLMILNEPDDVDGQSAYQDRSALHRSWPYLLTAGCRYSKMTR